ncbi:hypothetical protein V8D89_005652 [Ganoderma adspersum]
MPNSGKLQHHLDLLSHDKNGTNEELYGVYYFVKRTLITKIQLNDFKKRSTSEMGSKLKSRNRSRRHAPSSIIHLEVFVQCLYIVPELLYIKYKIDQYIDYTTIYTV